MPASSVTCSEPAARVTESLSVTPVSERTAKLAGMPASAWTAGDLAFYIREEAGRLNGPQLPCAHEDKIVADFLGRFGERGVAIARTAFEVFGGKWMGAPVTVRRFTASNDAFFAEAILSSDSLTA